ncbi:MAG: hypothetical protein AMXMBFR34_36640 [Myxococcaceae bacterium]
MGVSPCASPPSSSRPCTFECPLPGLSSAGTTSAGLWIASISLVGRDVLVAFEVPAAVPEARGWVTPAARNDHRLR